MYASEDDSEIIEVCSVSLFGLSSEWNVIPWDILVG